MLIKLLDRLESLAAVKNQSVGMRRRLNLYMLCLALAVFAALILVFSLTGLFSNGERQLEGALITQQHNATAALASQTDTLAARCIALSGQISQELSDTLADHGKDFAALNDDPELIDELQQRLYAPLSTVLQVGACSGVFVALDATVNTQAEQAENSRTGIYLRLSDLKAVGAASQHIVWFRGSAEVARDKQIQMHNRWNLEFDVSLLPGYQELLAADIARPADECLWTERIPLQNTWEDAILLCVPVLDAAGNVRGVCGVELSELYFQLSYPAVDSPYGSMITVLAPLDNDRLLLDKAMLGSPEGTYLAAEGLLAVRPGRYFNSYTSATRSYVGLHQTLSAASVSGLPLTAVTLIPESSFTQYLASSRNIWVFGSLCVLLGLLALAFFLSNRFVMPIAKSLKALQSDARKPPSSGISEIDELQAFLQTKEPEPGDLPANIEELLQDFAQRVATLTPMERTVLQYFIDGYRIEEIASLCYISLGTAKRHNTNLNKKLDVSTRDELLVYVDLFRRCKRLSAISYHR